MDSRENPYAAPAADAPHDQSIHDLPGARVRLSDEDAQRADDLLTRRWCIGYETMVRTMGWLYFMVGCLALLGFVGWQAKAVMTGRFDVVTTVMGLLVAAVAAAWYLLLSYGLRDLRWGPMALLAILSGLDITAAIVLAVLHRDAIILAYLPYDVMVLCLVASTKTRLVFSTRYKQIRRETPEVRCPPGPIVLVLLIAAASIAGPVVLTLLYRTNAAAAWPLK
ncbi:MAG: hypothetical protein K8T25_10195 [Planctomycetia bacterium]|nr:hypothetical protein [Planctomycetia bacterium]